MQDETFNYSVIKLIVCMFSTFIAARSQDAKVSLNEQFMVASLSAPKTDASLLEQQHQDHGQPIQSKNRVLHVLMRRLGSSKTFGENMIFMLNRASAPFSSY